MQKFNIVFKVLLPMFIGLFFIAMISIYSNFYNIKNNIELESEKYFDNTTTTLDYIVKKDILLMKSLITLIQKDKNIFELYQRNQKDKLLKYTLPIFEKLKINHDITHFYFHQKNRFNYLRVHNPKVNSDLINRITLIKSKDKLKPVSGVEFGISHNLTLRVVVPWIVEGEVLAFIELGKEMDKITQEYTDLTNTDVIFTIKKELISPKDFEKWKNKNHRNRSYHIMDKFYIIDSTIDKIDNQLKMHLNKSEESDNIYLENNNKKYYIDSKNYLDIQNNEIGKLHILKDVTFSYEELLDSIVKTTFIILFTLLLIVLYYFRHIKNIEKELNVDYKNIQDISSRDGLTKLYNKQHYLNNISSLIQQLSRFNSYITFILLDVDNFKKYNDNYGHLKGDEILKQISKIMQETFKRDTEYCFRVGGEEFLIVSASSDKRNGYTMSKKLCTNVKKANMEHLFNEDKNVITISIGIITQEITYNIDINQLYDKADKALYSSKLNGRDQVSIYKKDTLK